MQETVDVLNRGQFIDMLYQLVNTMPFCHREYNENEKLAKERFHVHERIWGDEKSWEDPDYPFDWTEGEFC